MEFVSAVFALDTQTIDLDYLSYNPYTIQTALVDCKKGYFVHISNVEDNRYVADGIVSDVQPDKTTQSISIRPLQALFDADIFSTPITDCITWIKNAITSIFISNSDKLQNRPIYLTSKKASKDLPLTEAFDATNEDTFNILSVITAALKHYNVVTACYLDMENMRIRVRIYQNTETKVIEGDLENVVEARATLGDSYGSINKVVVRRFINLGSGYLSCDTSAKKSKKDVDVKDGYYLDENTYFAVKFTEAVQANATLDLVNKAKKGSCSTAENKTKKEVSISDYTLTVDDYIWVKFSHPVGAGSTLNVNETADYPICTQDPGQAPTPIISGVITEDDQVCFYFNGSQFVLRDQSLPIFYNGIKIKKNVIHAGDIALFKLGIGTIPAWDDVMYDLVTVVTDETAYSYIIGYLSFFRGLDGKIGDKVKNSNRIVPVFVRHISIEQSSDTTYDKWYVDALTQSVEILLPEQYDQEIELTYMINDKIVEPLSMSIGTVVELHYKGEVYTSIYTEKRLTGNLITLVFGAIRTDLTKKLKGGTYTGGGSTGGYSSGGSSGGGGGSGGTTDYNKLSNKPEINGTTVEGELSLSDLGIPTTYSELSGKPSINGTTLSGNKTAAELGLQNELTAGNMVDITNDTVSAVIPFAEAEATSRTVFTATVPTIRSLEDGVTVLLCNTSGFVSNTNWTLNVNGLGALHVFNSMSMAQMTTQFAANATYLFTYDSSLDNGAGGWYMYTGYNSDTNTQAYLIRNYNATLVMKNTLYRYMICFTDHDGLLVPTANVSNSTSVTKTLTTDSFDPFGDIYYYSTTTTVTPGSSPSTSYMWKMRNDCNMRYGWNVSTTDFELKKSVYVRCVPQSDGQVKLDGNDCLVQELPTTEDGKVYIYLGRAYSGYQMELYFTHPVYYYKDGAIRTWDAGDYSAGNGIAISNQEISIADLIIDCGSSTVNVGV